jgi:RNA polymerase sigma-70 factor (ECF subfamily)
MSDPESTTPRHAADGDGLDTTSQLFLLVYDELRRVAADHLSRQRRGHTLQPTALVHEVYKRLQERDHVTWSGRRPFIALAALMMEQILINHAKQYAAAKRPSSRPRLSLEQAVRDFPDQTYDMLALREDLNEALEQLSAEDARSAQVVRLRFFGGLTVKQTAERLGVSVSRAEEDWRLRQTGKGQNNARPVICGSGPNDQSRLVTYASIGTTHATTGTSTATYYHGSGFLGGGAHWAHRRRFQYAQRAPACPGSERENRLSGEVIGRPLG